MQNSKSLGMTLLILVLVAGGIYALITYRDRPYEIRNDPASYPKGTTVSLYESLPPGFPAEVVLEEGKPLRSGTTTSSRFHDSTSVVYTSNKSVAELITQYEGNFTAKGWTVVLNNSSAGSGVIQAEKGGAQIILTISTLPESTMLTFQYNQK